MPKLFTCTLCTEAGDRTVVATPGALVAHLVEAHGLLVTPGQARRDYAAVVDE